MRDIAGLGRGSVYKLSRHRNAGQEEPHGLAIKDEPENYYEKEIHH